jgi:hypothetical protein
MNDKLGVGQRTFGEEHMGPRGGANEHALTSAADVELHIEELVLTGFAQSDRHRIGDAVERELARLLKQKAIPGTNSAAIDLVNAGRFQVAHGAKAQEIGRQIAQTVYGNITPAMPPVTSNKRSGSR